MTIIVVAFVGGALTIASPCILPVLPVVFSRGGHPFRRGGLPLLTGMALAFALVGSVAAVAGDWVVRANRLGRGVAMVVFAVLGVALLVPSLSDRLSRPWVRLGVAVQRRGGQDTTIGGSLLLGVSTGLLWTPCAGPILGLILAGLAIEGPGARGVLLLFAFGCGAASALALALLAGNRAARWLKGWSVAEPWMRRGLGVAVLSGVGVIAAGWDTTTLARLSLTTLGTATAFEQRLVDQVRPSTDRDEWAATATTGPWPSTPADTAGRVMPPLEGAVQWLNGSAYTDSRLRGQVVLVNFWTYSCINCLRALPYVQAWSEKYKDKGLVVVGVHTPEFAFEREPRNVMRAARNLRLSFPIAVDSDRAIWGAFRNQFWPAWYVADAAGTIRYEHAGEGQYDQTERVIRALLAERYGGETGVDGVASVGGSGAQAPPDLQALLSPETYVGYERQDKFASPEPLGRDQAARYTRPASPRLNEWGFEGRWTVHAEHATSSSTGTRIVFRFHARDLHLVLAPPRDGGVVRFRVSLDGRPPAEHHGVDVDRRGNGVVTEPRLYQLIRQTGVIGDRTFQIEFLDPGVRAYVFTFG